MNTPMITSEQRTPSACVDLWMHETCMKKAASVRPSDRVAQNRLAAGHAGAIAR
jgi:hypothetical protein